MTEKTYAGCTLADIRKAFLKGGSKGIAELPFVAEELVIAAEKSEIVQTENAKLRKTIKRIEIWLEEQHHVDGMPVYLMDQLASIIEGGGRTMSERVLHDETLTETRCGFRWGPVLVERCASHQGHVIVSIKTKNKRLDVRVTPKGFIRVGVPTPISPDEAEEH